MFVVGARELEEPERAGSVSRRYMRMKPRIKESPIQTCGVRGEGGLEGVVELGVARM